MPDLLDRVNVRQIRALANAGLASPASEMKRLYLRAKVSRRTAAREKRPYVACRRQWADEERDFKLLAKRSELSARTFHHVKSVIRREGIGKSVVRKFADMPTRPLSFITRATVLDRRGHTDAALDLLYDSVDELMRQSQFQKLDILLTDAPIAEMTLDILLGLLTATLPARSRIPSRKQFYRRVEKAIRDRGEFEPGLLSGLE